MITVYIALIQKVKVQAEIITHGLYYFNVHSQLNPLSPPPFMHCKHDCIFAVGKKEFCYNMRYTVFI